MSSKWSMSSHQNFDFERIRKIFLTMRKSVLMKIVPPLINAEKTIPKETPNVTFQKNTVLKQIQENQ